MDISGNFKEGKGTTGIAISEDGEILELNEISAKRYETQYQYWLAHEMLLQNIKPDHVTIEGYKLYNHKGMAASTQSNSELETPQLLGMLKYICTKRNIPYNIQFASEIKTRWSEDVLVRLGILEEKNGRYYWNGKQTNSHKRDALRHSLHWWRYKK